MLKASYLPYIFKFNFPGGTSRGILTEKPSWHIKLWHSECPEIFGTGEVSIIPGLSPELPKNIIETLKKLVDNPDNFINNFDLTNYPALKFGIETALLDLKNGGRKILFPSEFTEGKKGISINGLIWMGKKDEMLTRLKEKVKQGFTCIKIKVGAIDFQHELELLKYIRDTFSANDVEIRVDANGAFSPNEALEKLEKLNKYKLHSIEQPIKQNQWKKMAELCKQTPIPIALDEELIGITTNENKIKILETLNPHYVIFKPSLIGGLEETKKWSICANELNIGWWVTSALEGNIGLNAIAQWTYQNGSDMPQGLGTGQVFSNNIDSPLNIQKNKLWYHTNQNWGVIK